ncbi:MAG TPA: Calx-beta domain-containing protein [Myxococcaceae bacterium]|nr:Calx-beta domain-containing protein [Myxococcaceae bacterium]
MRTPGRIPLVVLVWVSLAPVLAARAQPQTATFAPVADASVEGSKHDRSRNFGTATTLQVDKTPVVRSFLRFEVAVPPGAIITGATLKLHTTTASSSAGWTLYKVADNTWSETLITYDTQPALGAQLGVSGPWAGCPCFTQVSIAGAHLTQGLNSFGIVTTHKSHQVFHSREGTNVPQLVVTYTPAPLPAVSINDITVTEGNGGTASATFSVSLSAPSTLPVTVSYSTADGTAVAPGDYQPTAGLLTFAPNETLHTIVVPVVGDLLSEPSESFAVNLSGPLNAVLADAQGVGTVLDNEAPALTLPLRAAFYAARYPEAWQVGGQYSHDMPVLGHYDSSSQSVVDAHLTALGAAKVRVSIASWSGQGVHQEHTRLPLLLGRTRALQAPLRWALSYEKEGLGSPSITELQADLDYLWRNYATDPSYAVLEGKPVLFVSTADDTGCEVMDRWAAANGAYGFHLILQAFPGHQECVNQPAGWYPHAPASAESRQPGQAFAISPGFWKADEPTARLTRDVARWRQNIRNMVASGEPWQLITTFNDWGQGTAAEEANGWATAAHGVYLDALANDGAEPPTADPVLVTAGDIAGPWTQDEATAQLIDTLNPDGVLLLGDNVYGSGSPSEYTNYYASNWGRHKAKTYPAAGNHDHATANLAGYCGYFGAAAQCKNGYSYYSFDLGNWHIIVLDSGCSSPATCANPMVAGSEMRAWLTADLAANTKPCTLAVWHHPRFSSGLYGNDPRSSEVFTELYNAGTELVLSGHEHDYERFAPQNPAGEADPAGIRQFVVGTGGTGLRPFGTVKPNSEVREASTHGVLKLTLRANGYDWQFVPIEGQTFTDTGTGACH